jgi:hypothetical protein
VSDRFRSLWTFYQFLNGVLKHLGEGPLPYSYDFQSLHRRIKELVHAVGIDNRAEAAPELEQLERELDRIRRDLARIEQEFPPSVMRRFFDHIKRQDEKVLNALLKFYLQSQHYEQDTLDKVDILYTRLAEVPIEDGRMAARDTEDLKSTFERLFEFTHLTPLPAAEIPPLVEAVVAIRSELEAIGDYAEVVESRVYDRYRRLKQRLGPAILNPDIQLEVAITNIAAKNRFEELFRAEEARVAGNTNRILDIERYIDRHPELTSSDLKEQIETFRRSRVRYESSLRSGNVRRDDITEMTRAMHKVLARFDPAAKRSLAGESTAAAAQAKGPASAPPTNPTASHTADIDSGVSDDQDATSLADVLPLDPLLNETLHKIMFALEMVVWDRLPTQVTEAPEIRNLELEPREVDTYRRLAQGKVDRGTAEWELDSFFLTSAALRVKMEDERKEISRLERVDNPERLFEVLERSAQSLERARDTDRRFQWFIDDMLFRGDTGHLEDIYRSRFRFLHAYSGLWLVHQRAGGLTPL